MLVLRGPNRRRGLTRALLSLPSAFLALAAPGLAAIPQRGTAEGSALARSALLERSDLGRGWSEAGAAPHKPVSLTCSTFNPSPHAVEIGRAGTPTWQRSSSGPFVSDTTYVYASRAQGDAAWSSLAQPKLVRCVAQALLAGSGGGVNFSIKQKQVLGLASVGAPARHYRVHGTAANAGQTVDVYLDMVVLGRGQVISALSISTFETAVASKLELRLARAEARRLPSG